MKTDLSKPVQTREGRPAKVVSHIAGGMFPVLAVVTHPDGFEYVTHHTLSGSATGVPGTSPQDLVNVDEFDRTYRAISLDGSRLGSAVPLRNVNKSEPWSGLALELALLDGQVFAAKVVNVEMPDA